MNWDQFKKGIGCRYQLAPAAAVLDDAGRELGRANDDWVLEAISPASVSTFRNARTGQPVLIAKDHIVDFRTDPARSTPSARYGFLVLKMQVFTQGERVFLQPNRAPAEPVMPAFAPRHLNAALERRLDELIPPGSKVMIIVTMGDAEAHAFAHEVRGYLERDRSVRLQQRMGIPPIPPGQNINKVRDGFEILIGART